MIRHSEGTDRAKDPYRVCYGYKHAIVDLIDHPAITGEWKGADGKVGEPLSDEMCRGVGLSPGCRSTAAGAYQIIRPTWVSIKNALHLPDFLPDSQDLACVEIIKRAGALAFIESGQFIEAVSACRRDWASLPGNTAGQPQRTYAALQDVYLSSGGVLV